MKRIILENNTQVTSNLCEISYINGILYLITFKSCIHLCTLQQCHSFNTSQFCFQTETLSLDLILWDCSLRAATLKMPVF
jgi:hypothetical protein